MFLSEGKALIKTAVLILPLGKTLNAVAPVIVECCSPGYSFGL
jgi:hypothetical protein